ncbi:putative pantothenate transporter protein [Neofusicoccum parvum UCRNP2]|uniref:MFS transporter n=2 Tax=Neofusicoccum parvum TaxID=310453 RepID=A0ACB5RZF3_9PEZI|nr:putative pantothenate transporter protein [Neofusicoccum parvum UCRNP2]GME25938.1 MFS transporter [Neofusicoccum parvum]
MSQTQGQERDPAAQKADEVVAERVKYDWRGVIWDTFNKSPEERRFLFKLDAALLSFASLGYFIKYLDQQNINSAFVSGMKEDLGLYGDELNIMQSCWTVGYVIGQLPSNIILTKFRPSLWIPTMEVLWTVLTFCLSRCSTAKQIYALRFFIGLAESTFYPGMQYIIGSCAIASMFSGYLMAAVYNLGGKGGYTGWQWLFIVDGIISLPIALAGYFVLPDVPEISKPFYLTKEEVAFAQKRMQLEGRKPRAPYTKAKVKKIFKSWHIYVLTLLYIAFNNGNMFAQPAFAQWLKASTNPKYTIAQINAYPTTTYAIWNIIVYVSLAVWDIPTGWHWACYILAGLNSGLSGLCMSWAHEICAEDNEERSIVIGSMNEMAYVVQAWLPLIVWKQTEAPQYRKGFITVAVIGGPLLIGTAIGTLILHNRENAQKAKRGGDVDAGSEDGEQGETPSPQLLTVDVKGVEDAKV